MTKSSKPHRALALFIFLLLNTNCTQQNHPRHPSSLDANTKAAVDMATSAQAAIYNLRKTNDVGSIMMLYYLNQRYLAGDLKNPGDWANAKKEALDSRNSIFNALQSVQNVKESEDPAKYDAVKTLIDSIFGSANNTPGVGNISAALQPSTNYSLKKWREELQLQTQLGNVGTASFYNAVTNSIGNETILQILASCEQDPRAKEQFGDLLNAYAHILPGQEASTVLSNNQDFANNSNIKFLVDTLKNNLDENGNFKAPIPDEIVMKYFEFLRGSSIEERKKLDALMASTNATETELRDFQNRLEAEKSKAAADTAKRAKEQLEEQNFQLKIAAAQSGLNIATFVISQSNPVLARRVSGMGDATLKITQLTHNYRKGMTGTSTAEFMSSVIFSGNILSIGVEVFSLFSDGGPSSNDMILASIKDLREDIHSLQNTTQARFDQIDRTLNYMFTMIVGGFDNLGVQLAQVNIDTSAIRSDISTLASQTARLGLEVRSDIQALAEREFSEKVNSCLIRKQIFDHSDAFMDSRLFEDCFLYFRTSASINSTDSIANAPIPPDFKMNASFDAILSRPTEELYPLLTKYAFETFHKSDGSALIPNLGAFSTPANPVVWAMATRKFIDLGRMFPQYLKRGDVNSINVFYGPSSTFQSISRFLVKNSNGEIQMEFWRELFNRYHTELKNFFDSLHSDYVNWTKVNSGGVDVLAAKPEAPAAYSIKKPAIMSPCPEGVTQEPHYVHAWSPPNEKRLIPVTFQLSTPDTAPLPSVVKLAQLLVNRSQEFSGLDFCYDSVGYLKDSEKIEWYEQQGNATDHGKQLTTPFDGLGSEAGETIGDRVRPVGNRPSQRRVQKHTISYGRPLIGVRVIIKLPTGSLTIGHMQIAGPKNIPAVEYLRSSDQYLASYGNSLELQFHLFSLRNANIGEQISNFGSPSNFDVIEQSYLGQPVEQLNQLISKAQTELAKSYFNNLKEVSLHSGSVSDALTRLDGQALLIQKYVEIALPMSLLRNEAFRSQFFGKKGIATRKQVFEIFNNSENSQDAFKSVGQSLVDYQKFYVTLNNPVRFPEIDPHVRQMESELDDFRQYWSGLGSNADIMTAYGHLKEELQRYTAAH